MKPKRSTLRRRVLLWSSMITVVLALVPLFGTFDTGKQVAIYLTAVVSNWIVVNAFAPVWFGGGKR